MASLALLVSIILLFTILIGPITYCLVRIGFPSFLIHLLGIVCILIGINFCCTVAPLWYLGLIPIYFGYISIVRASKKQSEG